MKKTYITPMVATFKVNTASIIASSIDVNGGDNDSKGDSWQEGGQLGRDDRPANPNIWDQQW